MRHRAAQRGLPIVMVTLALGVAGCGSSSSPSTGVLPPVTGATPATPYPATGTTPQAPSSAPTSAAKAKFILRADAICKADGAKATPLSNRLTALRSSKSVAAMEANIPAILDQLAAASQSTIARLQALPEPAGDQATLAKMWAAQANVITDGRVAAAALSKGDLQGFTPLRRLEKQQELRHEV